MKNFTGFILKQQRLQQGLSQEALCKGICAVSYLSKIEQGLSQPSPGILRQLMMTLGISYFQDPDVLQEAREMLEGFFDKYFHSETASRESNWLNRHQQEMENSELHLGWHLFKLYSLLEKYGKKAPACHQEAAYLARFLDYMEEDQLFYYYAGAGQIEGTEQAELLRMAETLRPTSFVKQSMAEAYFSRKDYMNAIAAAERAYAAAAEEGNLPILLWSSYLLGACYAGFNDLGFMQRYYRRARELARSYDHSITTLIDYQIGSAYLEHARYQEALPWLSASFTPQEAGPGQRFLTAQKLAICYFEQDNAAQGLEYLQLASDLKAERERMPVIYDRLLYMTTLRYVQGDRSSPEYEDVLRELYQSQEPSLGEGYRRLFSTYLVQLYTSQRKYKEALAVQSAHAYLG